MTYREKSAAGSSTDFGARTEAQGNTEALLTGEAAHRAEPGKIDGPANSPNRLIFQEGSAGRLKTPLPAGIIARSAASEKPKE